MPQDTLRSRNRLRRCVPVPPPTAAPPEAPRPGDCRHWSWVRRSPVSHYPAPLHSRNPTSSTHLQMKRLVCRECGKTCRTDVEWDLHSKRTGHPHCDDRTNEAAEVIDSEAQMKAAAAAEAGVAGGSGSQQEAEAVEMVPAEVDGELLKSLEDMVGGCCASACVYSIEHRLHLPLPIPLSHLSSPLPLPTTCRALPRRGPRGRCTTAAAAAWRRRWAGWRSTRGMPTSTRRCWCPRCGVWWGSEGVGCATCAVAAMRASCLTAGIFLPPLQTVPKKKLSAEEAKAAAAELLRK